MIEPKICLNCETEFIPSKNDKRIKFCSEKCRCEYRLKNDYMKIYYSKNKSKWKERQATEVYKNNKNSARIIKYHTDDIFKQKVRDRTKQYRVDHPTAKRAQDLKEKYGISLQEYDEILKKQNDRCAICGKKSNENGRYKVLYVDHDHKTGKVRGLLCESCNFALGLFRDKIDIVENAVKYLKENT